MAVYELVNIVSLQHSDNYVIDSVSGRRLLFQG